MSKPFTVLVRRLDPKPLWERWTAHYTEEEAWATVERTITGRGVTSWVWVGPSDIAGKMMADPNYDPDAKEPGGT